MLYFRNKCVIILKNNYNFKKSILKGDPMFVIFIILSNLLFSQNLDVEKYKEFMNKNQDMNSNQILEMYPAGEYLENINLSLENVEYLDKVIEKYNLTKDELVLLKKNGFVVPQRIQHKTFFNAYREIFKNDLPNYISADLLLYSTHFNMQKIIESIELDAIQMLWTQIVSKLSNDNSKFLLAIKNEPADSYNREVFIKAYNNTLDYIAITKHLFNNTTKSEGKVGKILKYIEEERFEDINLFSDETLTPFDFSQFKVRGFYKDANAGNFFKGMTWLSRVEVIIENGKNITEQYSKFDLDAMLLQAVMLSMSLKNDYENYLLCDKTYNKLIGRQDNITPTELNDILDEMKIDDIAMLLDSNRRNDLKSRILNLSSTMQSYSGNVSTNIGSDIKGTLPVVFKVFGQRPVLDGYVTSNTTYDNIKYKGELIKRWIPSTLDVAFAFGNNAAAQLLLSELNKYYYGSNLAANRYLFDNRSDSIWGSTCYDSWLNILRSFNVNNVEKRQELPRFAQTAAWNQKNLNTQLASWSQIRRDFILSAKQPYTDSYSCSFPKSLLEPNVEFFKRLKNHNLLLREIIEELPIQEKVEIKDFFDKFDILMNNLIGIAGKQYHHQNLTETETSFLQSMMIPMSICKGSNYIDCGSSLYKGWFNQLFLGINETYDETFLGPTFKEDYTVADVHTIPQEGEERVGKVLHAGVGPINLAFILSQDDSGKPTIFIGPVYSYYEYITRGFKRLDEDEWKEYLMDVTKEFEPQSFAKYYMTDNNGKKYGAHTNFFLNKSNDVKKDGEDLKVNFYPNPVKDKLFISMFPDKINTTFNIEIYDLLGNIIIKEKLNVNSLTNYIVDIDLNRSIKKGVYICKISNGVQKQSFKFIKEN